MFKRIQQLAFLIACSLSIASANLVVNGDFEQGNTSFTTFLTYTPNLYPEGTYYIGTDPALYHPLWPSFGDTTSGTGKMMMINGGTDPAQVVWGQSLTSIAQNTIYYFATSVASNYNANPSNLRFRVNGVTLGSTFSGTNKPGIWGMFYGAWFSGSATSADLEIVNQDTVANGNDFSLDDVYFDVTRPSNGQSVTAAVPEPGTLGLVAAVLLGLGSLRRNRSC